MLAIPLLRIPDTDSRLPSALAPFLGAIGSMSLQTYSVSPLMGDRHPLTSPRFPIKAIGPAPSTSDDVLRCRRGSLWEPDQYRLYIAAFTIFPGLHIVALAEGTNNPLCSFSNGIPTNPASFPLSVSSGLTLWIIFCRHDSLSLDHRLLPQALRRSAVTSSCLRMVDLPLIFFRRASRKSWSFDCCSRAPCSESPFRVAAAR